MSRWLNSPPHSRHESVRCRLENLECRTVPSRAVDVFDAGDFYRVNGVKVPLERWANAVAVRLNAEQPQATLDGLTSPTGPFTGFRVARSLGTTTWLLTSPPSGGNSPSLALSGEDDARLIKAEAVPGVTWVSNVFQNGESGTWMAATDQIIVALHEGVDATTFFASDRRFLNIRRLDGTPDQFTATLTEGAGPATLTISEALLADPRVRWATPDFYQNWQRFYLPNDPMVSSQWHLQNLSNDADVDAPEAWDINPGGDPSVVIAIVDDGIEITHPDLQPNIFVNPGETPGNGVDDDGNGWIDDVNGWDFTSAGSGGVIGDNDPGPSTVDDEHGTSTAGVAAARGNNALGVAGAAYNSRILPARIFSGPSATSDAGISSAIYYSAGRKQTGVGTWNAATLTSNSWGGGALTQPLIDSFTWAAVNGRAGKGVPSFIASGNGGSASVSSPAILSGTVPGVIAVGASTNGDVRSSYSQYGPQLDFVAPSNGGSLGITTTDRTGTLGYNTSSGTSGNYTSTFGGTSSATPLAAGIGALILSEDPDITAAAVRGLMRNTTDYIGGAAYGAATGFVNEYGYGRVNARTALAGIDKAEIQVLDVTANIADNTGVVDFGTLNVGATGTKLLRIRNQGTLPLSLSGLTISAGPFAVVDGFGKSTLNVGESTTFTLRFLPTTGGLVTRTVSFTSNDTDEAAFDFTARGTGLQASISGRAYEDWNADGSRDANEPGVAGAVVYFDANANGKFDTTQTFKSTDVTKTIPNPGTVSSTLAVAGVSGTMTDVNVTLTINHLRDQDLDVYLTSPTGAKVELFTDVGGTGDNFSSTTLDDQAATSITAGVAPFSGTYRPEGLLSAFNGLSANGTWTLSVTDDSSTGTAGSLVSWSLSITGSDVDPSVTTDANGFYAFNNVPSGDYNLGRVLPAGFNGSGVASYSVSLPLANSFAGNQDFGMIRPNTIYGRAFWDVNANGAPDLGEGGIAGRTIYLDANNNAALDNKATTNSTVVAIPDNNATGASSIIAISGLGTVGMVRVKVNITHTYDGDIALSLISPQGTSIPLSSYRGGAGQNYLNTTFDDAAAIAISAAAAPFAGSFRPESPLAALIGQNANGNWTLKVVDSFSQDVGTINNWTLEVGEPNAITDVNGLYRFTSLPAGSQRVRQVVPSLWTETAPVGGGHVVNVVSGQSYSGRDFGSTDGTTPPLTVSVEQAAGQADPSNAAAINFTVTFSAPVSDFADGDVVIGGTAGATTAVVTGSGLSYNVAVSGMTQTGTVSITIPAGVASDNLASTSGDNVVLSDRVAPTASAVTPPDVTSPGGTAAAFTVTLSDDTSIAVGSIASGDVRVTGPNGFDVPATLLSVNLPTDGTPRVATFTITAPGASWDIADNGTYSLLLQSGAVADTAGNSNASINLGTFNVMIVPTLGGVQINDGSAQRSRITSLTVTFNSVISLPAVTADAFQLSRTGPGSPTANVDFAVDTSLSTASQTVAKLTFTAALTEFSSLIDGQYALTILGSQVLAGGVPLDGDGNGTPGGDFALTFHRLFGDIDGDANVDTSDFATFRLAFGGSDSTFDFDADGDVDTSDFSQFRQRYGTDI